MEQSRLTSQETPKKVPTHEVFDLKLSDHYRLIGKNLFTRTHCLEEKVEPQKRQQLWLYGKSSLSTPSSTCKGHDIYGNMFDGPNFATQDYLGLGSSIEARNEAARVAKEYGVHSGGAALAFGVHPYYTDFQREIAEFWGVKNVILYSTGWMAGYGAIKGLIRPWDHIVMDKLAHNCLQEGARATTENVHVTSHLDVKAMIKKVKEIREKDNENGILVITESLFSMDSDTPDLVYLQSECKKLDAYILLDMAHDNGCVGKEGLGALEVQNVKDRSNIILIGSGSKTLGTNIGFVGCEDPKAIDYMRFFSAPFMYSNAASPPQCAVALHNLRIVRSERGVALRKKVMDNILYLREQLTTRGFKCFGNPSPIVIVLIGDELLSRVVVRLLLDNSVIVNGVEFPMVEKGKARLRLQLQAIHTKEHLDTFVEKVIQARAQGLRICEELNKNPYEILNKSKL